MKISFLIPAHNEEKIISKPLDNLAEIKKMYPNIEVLVGLDGCTDKTEQIVKQYKFVKYFVLNERGGKPEVIDRIIKKATGDIIIIHDCDWIFKVKNKENLLKMLDYFSDEKLGGIAESFTIEWASERENEKSIGFLSEMWAGKLLLDYQRKYFTKMKNNGLYVDKEKMKFPFLVNIFRKELYKKNFTLADDFERCLNILNEGYDIRISETLDLPRFISVYNKTSVKDVIKKKLRTAIARQQLKNQGFKANKKEFVKIYLFICKNFYKTNNLRAMLGIGVWAFAIALSEIKNLITKKLINTKEGWTMRAKR